MTQPQIISDCSQIAPEKHKKKHRECASPQVEPQWFSDQEVSEADSPHPRSCLPGGTPSRRRISLLSPPLIVSLQVQYSSCSIHVACMSILTVHWTHCHSTIFQWFPKFYTCKHDGSCLHFPQDLGGHTGHWRTLECSDHNTEDRTCRLPWAQTVRTPWQVEIDQSRIRSNHVQLIAAVCSRETESSMTVHKVERSCTPIATASTSKRNFVIISGHCHWEGILASSLEGRASAGDENSTAP